MMLSKARNALKLLVIRATQLARLRQRETTLANDAQAFWTDTQGSHFQHYSHWRGTEALQEHAWLEIGRRHLGLFETFVSMTPWATPVGRVLEWGCGGGANAIHFAKRANEFVGVDVSAASVNECERVLRDAGLHNFRPVVIDVAAPETAIDRAGGPCDVFLCTYVFELLPSPEYGLRLLRLAHQLLREGGVALIQIKYQTAAARTRPRRWGYRLNAANMTTYAIDEFWEHARVAGFQPRAVYLEPKQPLVGDERYAYFFLERPNVTTHSAG